MACLVLSAGQVSKRGSEKLSGGQAARRAPAVNRNFNEIRLATLLRPDVDKMSFHFALLLFAQAATQASEQFPKASSEACSLSRGRTTKEER